jgi:hypothetical protein
MIDMTTTFLPRVRGLLSSLADGDLGGLEVVNKNHDEISGLDLDRTDSKIEFRAFDSVQLATNVGHHVDDPAPTLELAPDAPRHFVRP